MLINIFHNSGGNTGVISFLYWFFFGIAFFRDESPSPQKRVSFFVFLFLIFITLISITLIDSCVWSDVVFYGSLLIAALYDAVERNIPRFCSLGLLPIGIFFGGGWIAVLSAAFTYLIFRVIMFLYKKYSGLDGMGEGDPEFAAAIAAFVGFELIGPIIVIACLVGVLIHYAFKTEDIPFAAALSIATIFMITVKL